MHTYQEAYLASLKYFEGNELAAKVFVDKYALKKSKDELDEATPADMHRRIAKELYRVEKAKFGEEAYSEDYIFSLLDKYSCIIPQGSPLYGIGNPYSIISLSNCFVLDQPQDSYADILRIDEQVVQISKRRGGVGISLDNLRPKGTPTKNSSQSSTGIVSWMNRYSNSIREVGQCLSGDSLILTSNGLKKIKLVNDGEMVWTKEGWTKVKKVVNNGIKKLFKVTTTTGYSVTCSEDHILQTFDNNGLLTEHKLKELEAGDNIVLSIGNGSQTTNVVNLDKGTYVNSNNKPANCKLPYYIDTKLAYILGYSYGDGHVESNDHGELALALACSNDYPEIKLKLISYINYVFCYNPNKRPGDGDLEKISINNKTIIQFLKSNGLLKEKSSNIIFPDKIIQADPEIQKAFISGYFDADGDVAGKKAGYRFRSINLQFLEKTQIILSSLGIASKISFEDRSEKGWQTLYTLAVVGKTSTSLMCDFIESEKISSSLYISKRECWLTPFKAKSFNIKTNKYNYCPDNSQYLSLAVVNKLSSKEKVNKYLLQDQITKIEEVESDETYDLMLESEHLFWCNGIYVHNSGRRGALMLTLNVHHPDILDFIKAKSDLKAVTGANVSVQYTDEFLSAVDKEQQYEQRWPLNDKATKLAKHNELNIINQRVSASEIWNEAVNQAWSNAEPGIQFIDQVRRESPADCYEGFETITSNPCQPVWAKVLTPDGIREFQDIEEGDKIWSKDGWTKVVKKWSTGKKKVYKYTTTGGVFYGTEDHKLVVDNKNTKTKAVDAEKINIITGPVPQSISIDNQAIVDGLVIGDGSVHKASNNLVGLYIGEDDSDYLDSEIKSYVLKERFGVSPNFYEVKTNISCEELPPLPERTIPDRYLKANASIVCSFLRGLYSANGSVCGNRITLKSSSLQLIEEAQMMLSSVGIRSYYTTNKAKVVEFNNGEYLCKQSYDLNITVDRNKFLDQIGFLQEYKNNKVERKDSSIYKHNYDIVSTQEISTEEVFDITVDNDSHTYWTQGCNVSNCSEIFLSALDSCRLLAINLMYFVENPFEENAYFNFVKFYEHAQVAQRLMDDIVDLEIESIKKIINKIEKDPEEDYIKSRELELWQRILQVCKTGRRTGVGITALGDVIASIGQQYGSNESIQTVEKIYKTLKFGCYRESIELAKRFGTFEVWNHKKEKDCPFFTRWKNETLELIETEGKIDSEYVISGQELYRDMKKYGRRHIAILTTAPTGTISTQAGYKIKNQWYFGTSSGIEPVYQTSYIRRKKGNPSDKDFRSDFIDQNGDHWMEFKVYHEGVNAFMDVSGEEEDASPYFNACAPDIDWVKRVELQAAAGKHVDHSISSTVNLPNHVTKETVNKIFMTAWKAGLKGITVYRDGCRSGVLIEEKKGIPKHDAPKRPKELDCDVHRIVVKGNPYYVLVGLLDGEPYETFAGKDSFIDNDVKHGKIIKMGRPKCYKAVLDDETEIAPLHAMSDENEEALMRMTSTALRHGAELEFIITQLSKTKGELTSFAKAVSRALKKYITDGTKSKEKCTDCGAQLIFSEGCLKCSSCTFSKCS